MRTATTALLLLSIPAFVACGGGDELVATDVRLALTHADHTARALTGTAAVGACDASAELCTPTNLSGRIYSGGAMWGELGVDAFAITMLGADEEVISNPSQGSGGSLEFSVLDGTVLGGQYAAPDAGSEAKIVSRMEFNYDYLDATVELEVPGSPMAGTWVIRTVFVDTATSSDVDGTMHRGDKLVRRAEEATFEWCDRGACSSMRSDEAIQEPKLVDYVYPGDGNLAYIPFAVPVSNELMLTGDELREGGGMWSAAFDMTGAVRFSSPPAAILSRSDLLESFELRYAPDQAHPDDHTTISVNLEFLTE